MRPAASTFSNSVNGPKQTSATGNRPTTSTQSGKPPLPPANRARINHVEAQEAQQATGVALGEFLVNSVKATVLFDSGASHSFISSSFVEKHNIPTIPLKKPLLTRTPGADIPCQLGCVGVQILLRGVVFTANLIVIKSQDIDVILGMNWLSSHQGVITCKNKTVHLVHPDGTRVFFHVDKPTRDPMNFHVQIQTIHDVPITREYPHVFPDELPGMPLDRDIEFIIDLYPGTPPIAKRPYECHQRN
ncbi:hypothetical protein U9M48_044700 [Paspalum notatum var. saurae]|uniref:Gag-pol polyprotein n=1 Tax=Paspalum notatum var. saurae TaxID=547442 RepID=A0AAQ3UXM1_PASNO